MPTPIRKPTTPDQRSERPFSMRAFAGQPTSVDAATRSFDIVITTETPVVQYNKGPTTWAHAHIVQYDNGKRAMLIMSDDGRYEPARETVEYWVAA